MAFSAHIEHLHHRVSGFEYRVSGSRVSIQELFFVLGQTLSRIHKDFTDVASLRTDLTLFMKVS